MPQRQTRSAEEQRLLEKAKRYLPGGTLGNLRFSDDVAFVVKAGKGSKIYDMSGNQYIDYLLGSGPMILGHAHAAVVAAVGDYLERGSTYFTLNAPHVPRRFASAPRVPRPPFSPSARRERSPRRRRSSSSRADTTAAMIMPS